MLSQVTSFGTKGIEGYKVSVEADCGSGLPSFDVVGLPDASVRESRDRVRSAIKHNGYTYPTSKITINLAPGNTQKSGPLYDLPIFISVLKSTGQLGVDLDDFAFVGELSLAGEIRPILGAVSIAISARDEGVKKLFLSPTNAVEASIISGIDIIPVESVAQLIDYLYGKIDITPSKTDVQSLTEKDIYNIDFYDVKGQESAKRAIEIAAAGGHNVLMIGPPGTGKSMLASRIPTILPPLEYSEVIEATKVYSVAGKLSSNSNAILRRPFREPHHTISPVGLSGGGSFPRPGEISLAHCGVLFLDEIPEFSKTAMETLRQPIERGEVTISRAAGTVTYPCNIMFVAAMNPCPCGYFGHPTKRCTCSPNQIQRYVTKISGPLLDRIDIHVEVASVNYDKLADNTRRGDSSSEIRQRVNVARDIQRTRFSDRDFYVNSDIPSRDIASYCKLSKEGETMLKMAFEKLSLSARAYDRILKLSRTIADLDGTDLIENTHIAEAVQYRSLDRKYWFR